MGLGIKVCAAPHHCYVTNVKCYSSTSSAASFGSVALRSKKPTIPEINEPRIIPSLASLSTDAASGPLNERVAMNRETVKPIPPSIETDASIFHVEWRGIRANPHLIVAHENRNIPVNLPINKPPNGKCHTAVGCAWLHIEHINACVCKCKEWNDEHIYNTSKHFLEFLEG